MTAQARRTLAKFGQLFLGSALILLGAGSSKARGGEPNPAAALPQSQAETHDPRYENLGNLMEHGLHEEYTFLSFTVWHDTPLDDAKMDAIADSAAHIVSLADELRSQQQHYALKEWKHDDNEFFAQKALQLSRVAQELERAGRKHQSDMAVSFFMHLDETCQRCHSRFRPDLVQGKNF